MFRRDEKAAYSFRGFEHGDDELRVKSGGLRAGSRALLVRTRIRASVLLPVKRTLNKALPGEKRREILGATAAVLGATATARAVRGAMSVFLRIGTSLKLGRVRSAVRVVSAKTIPAIKNAFCRTRQTVVFILQNISRVNGMAVLRGGRDRLREIIDGRPYVRVYALPVSIGVAALCGIILFSTLMTRDITYYEYSYGGKVLGVVKDAGDVYRTVSRPEAMETLNERVGASVVLDDDENIEVRKVIKLTSSEVSVDGEDDIISNIATLDDVSIVGRTVHTGKDNIGTLASEAEVDKLLGLIR
jgi:hypothetical protein